MVVANERPADDVVGVAAEHCRYAHELEDVVLVYDLKRRVAAYQVVIGANGYPQSFAVADLDYLLGPVGRERVVVEVRGDMVVPVRVAPKDAKLQALSAEGFRPRNDGLEIWIRGKCARHEPDRVVVGLWTWSVGKRFSGWKRCDESRRAFQESAAAVCIALEDAFVVHFQFNPLALRKL